MFLASQQKNHRVTIERTSLSKETYTVKHPRKIFPSCDVYRGVDTYVDVRVNGFEELSPNHSPRQPHTRVNIPENVTRWEYFSGVFDFISFHALGCPLYSYSMKHNELSFLLFQS